MPVCLVESGSLVEVSAEGPQLKVSHPPNVAVTNTEASGWPELCTNFADCWWMHQMWKIWIALVLRPCLRPNTNTLVRVRLRLKNSHCDSMLLNHAILAVVGKRRLGEVVHTVKIPCVCTDTCWVHDALKDANHKSSIGTTRISSQFGTPWGRNPVFPFRGLPWKLRAQVPQLRPWTFRFYVQGLFDDQPFYWEQFFCSAYSCRQTKSQEVLWWEARTRLSVWDNLRARLIKASTASSSAVSVSTARRWTDTSPKYSFLQKAEKVDFLRMCHAVWTMRSIVRCHVFGCIPKTQVLAVCS